ncbi:MAG: hypothetical protein RIC19_20165 [Phaeodactylibacter sp.]|uniref:hypothetical protein n=1 Tax=Phaeodactylibacter sp. TaxID=1940289 RepID=UPI0032EC6FE9
MRHLMLLFLMLPISVSAQSSFQHQAPSLQIGLGGLSFGRGTLDAEVIASVISDKQEEVRVRLIKNMFLGKIEEAGGLNYIYLDNIINTVLEERNAEARTRNIYENTVNLVFVYALSDYYFALCEPELVALAEAYGGQKTGQAMAGQTFARFQLSESGERPNQGLIAQSSAITFSTDSLTTDFKALLLDMASEAVRNDPALQQLGLLRTMYRNSGSEALNAYLTLEHPVRRPLADAVYTRLQNRLAGLIDYIGLVNYLFRTTNFKVRGASMGLDLGGTTGLRNMEEIGAQLDSVRQYVRQAIGKEGRTELSEEELQVLLSFLGQLQQLDLDNLSPGALSDLIFELYNDVLPVLERLAKNSQYFIDTYFELNTLLQALVKTIFEEGFPFNYEELRSHLLFRLLAKLYEFDQAATYDDYLNALAGLSDIFPNEDTKAALNKIISLLRSYTEIIEGFEENEALDFDVESFLVSLQNINYDRWRPLSFIFNVGINNAHFPDGLVLSSGESLSNYTFAGEKIGIRLNLLDWAYINSFGRQETFTYWGKRYLRLEPAKTPTVSNLHLLLYGSGLLYNLANTGTTPDFNRPLVGGGLGLTFFNQLDLNATAGVPVNATSGVSTPLFLNIGFDIRFDEYLQALNERRRQRRYERRVDALLATPRAY